MCGENATHFEGILTHHSPERCWPVPSDPKLLPAKSNTANRIFVATRVDNYHDFIFDSMKKPFRSTVPPAPSTDPTEPFIIIDELKIKIEYIAVAALLVFAGLVLLVAIFMCVVNRCKLFEAKETANPKVHRLQDAVFTSSINLVLPYFLLITRIIIYCRLREAIQDELMEQQQTMKNHCDEVISKKSMEKRYQNTYPPP